MSHVEEVGNTLAAMLGQLPPEQLHPARAWIEEYALPTLTEIGQGSTSPELAEAVALLEQARELIDDVLALSDNTRGHLVSYLATLGVTSEQPPPSLPHPSTTPRTPTDSSRDHSWIDQVRQRLPEHTGGQTTGLTYDQDGTELTETSGREEVSERARLNLHDSTWFSTDDRGAPAVFTHVEVKYAQRMKERGQTHGVVVLNNPICDMERGCGAAVQAILPQGSTLVVWEPGATKPIELRGKARP
ncbi:SCP1.201-like deaminase [Actinopolyspora lacussalsi subsp. righensis]|uniref:SCP1.201-like deaminase n=1 Tax=Actinopolyspora righensis TaxID=995060 RepID=A0A1I7C0U4_9ACTN|nr:DddA-like double-stranded DNA deaminase toxin [Actinopolyspora righensis]SFT93025.1 SCP1.201-like deaminase [Actinopolyspora righensis]